MKFIPQKYIAKLLQNVRMNVKFVLRTFGLFFCLYLPVLFSVHTVLVAQKATTPGANDPTADTKPDASNRAAPIVEDAAPKNSEEGADTPEAKIRRSILKRIERYRIYSPAGYVVTGSMTSENGNVKDMALYYRKDGVFVKIKDRKTDRFYYGLRSPDNGTLYIDSVKQRWSVNPPYIDRQEINFGDLLVPSYNHDYTIIKIGSNLNGNEKIITLIPKKLGVPYGKIILRTNQEYIPLEAELYSVAGEIKHYVQYKKYKKIGNLILPSKIIFTTSIYRIHPIVVEFLDYQKIEINGNFFSPNNLSFFNSIE